MLVSLPTVNLWKASSQLCSCEHQFPEIIFYKKPRVLIWMPIPDHQNEQCNWLAIQYLFCFISKLINCHSGCETASFSRQRGQERISSQIWSRIVERIKRLKSPQKANTFLALFLSSQLAARGVNLLGQLVGLTAFGGSSLEFLSARDQPFFSQSAFCQHRLSPVRKRSSLPFSLLAVPDEKSFPPT